MALTNAERQKRFRDRRKVSAKPVPTKSPQDRRPRYRRWTDAVEVLVRLQQEYRDWYDVVPETRHDAAPGELLALIGTLDLS